MSHNIQINRIIKSYPFLQGGGEMGELTRNFDWSQTPIGSPDRWPQSLRTVVALVLRSAAPMCLHWGRDAPSFFYNDAFRTMVGSGGKHPAQGKMSQYIWPHYWDFAASIADQVFEDGESVYMADKLVPIDGNGGPEDAYFTFSFSSVLDETYSIAGVLVTCLETTSQRRATHEDLENNRNLRNILSQVNAGIAQAGLDLKFTEANQRYCEMVGYTIEELRELRNIDITHPEDREVNREQLEGCIRTGKNFIAEKRYIRKDGTVIWVNNSVSQIKRSQPAQHHPAGTGSHVHLQRAPTRGRNCQRTHAGVLGKAKRGSIQ